MPRAEKYSGCHSDCQKSVTLTLSGFELPPANLIQEYKQGDKQGLPEIPPISKTLVLLGKWCALGDSNTRPSGS